MENKAIAFDVKKLGFFRKVSKKLIMGGEMAVDLDFDDFVKNTLTVKLEAWFLEHQTEKRVIDYYFPRPKFSEWFWGKIKGTQRKVQIQVDVNDLLLDPPPLKDGTMRFYVIETINENTI